VTKRNWHFKKRQRQQHFQKSSTLALGESNNNSSGSVCAVAWSFDGKVIASVGDDSRIMLWDAKKVERLTELKGHKWLHFDTGCVLAALFSSRQRGGGEVAHVVNMDLTPSNP